MAHLPSTPETTCVAATTTTSSTSSPPSTPPQPSCAALVSSGDTLIYDVPSDTFVSPCSELDLYAAASLRNTIIYSAVVLEEEEYAPPNLSAVALHDIEVVLVTPSDASMSAGSKKTFDLLSDICSILDLRCAHVRLHDIDRVMASAAVRANLLAFSTYAMPLCFVNGWFIRDPIGMFSDVLGLWLLDNACCMTTLSRRAADERHERFFLTRLEQYLRNDPLVRTGGLMNRKSSTASLHSPISRLSNAIDTALSTAQWLFGLSRSNDSSNDTNIVDNIAKGNVFESLFVVHAIHSNWYYRSLERTLVFTDSMFYRVVPSTNDKRSERQYANVSSIVFDTRDMKQITIRYSNQHFADTFYMRRSEVLRVAQTICTANASVSVQFRTEPTLAERILRQLPISSVDPHRFAMQLLHDFSASASIASTGESVSFTVHRSVQQQQQQQQRGGGGGADEQHVDCEVPVDQVAQWVFRFNIADTTGLIECRCDGTVVLLDLTRTTPDGQSISLDHPNALLMMYNHQPHRHRTAPTARYIGTPSPQHIFDTGGSDSSVDSSDSTGKRSSDEQELRDKSELLASAMNAYSFLQSWALLPIFLSSVHLAERDPDRVARSENVQHWRVAGRHIIDGTRHVYLQSWQVRHVMKRIKYFTFTTSNSGRFLCQIGLQREGDRLKWDSLRFADAFQPVHSES
jgi:hypothetical protein